MPVPALIEYPTSIWFCILEDDSFIKVAEVAGGVTELDGYRPKSLKQVRGRDRQRPRLLCVGRLAEETVKATGQWPALLRLMAAQMEKIFTVGNFKPPKKRKLKPAPFDLQAWIWERDHDRTL